MVMVLQIWIQVKMLQHITNYIEYWVADNICYVKNVLK